MGRTEYNLLDERWIKVLNEHSRIEELSLTDVFRHAHELHGLNNELPTLDFALIRLLLAVLHAVFIRTDIHGNAAPLRDTDGAIERWREIYEQGRFPVDAIQSYLEKYRDRFYLIHPERPFYQVAGMDKATSYGAQKLIGDISQSENKQRLFSGRENRNSVSFSEATRWLVYLNAYDDTSAKPKGRASDGGKLPSPGAGYLGKLGMVIVNGKNLFDTLMLNFVLVDDKENLLPDSRPTWELDDVRRDERVKIVQPRGLAELLTIQSRRIELRAEGDQVTGYKLLGGDFFDIENAFIEQMTLWRMDNYAKTLTYRTRRHNPDKPFWRDFPALVSSEEGRTPGVLEWISLLYNEGLIGEFQTDITIAGIRYGDKDFFVDGIISDNIAVNAALLSKLGSSWRTRIIDVLKETDNTVRALTMLASNIALAMGDDTDKNRIAAVKKPIRENAYYELDEPFRNWLKKLRVNQNIDSAMDAWREIVRSIIISLGNALVDEAPERAFSGRYIKDKRDKEILYCTPLAYRWFLYGSNGVYKAIGPPKEKSTDKKDVRKEVKGDPG
jgi:CRISPR system Cascade subunit CasA